MSLRILLTCVGLLLPLLELLQEAAEEEVVALHLRLNRLQEQEQDHQQMQFLQWQLHLN